MASFSDLFWLDENNFQGDKSSIRLKIPDKLKYVYVVGVGQSQRSILTNSLIEFPEWPRPTHVAKRHTWSINRLKLI